MPNWCSCDLSVVGSQGDLQEFRIRAASDPDSEAKRAKLNGAHGSEEQTAAMLAALNPEKQLEELNHDIFVPCPDDIKNSNTGTTEDKEQAKKNLKKYGAANWYDWNCKYLGSKWGICHSELINAGPRSLRYRFDSPWSPPTPVIVAMSAQHPKLRFKLDAYEQGMGYQVHEVYKGGKCIKTIEADYHGHRGG